MTKYVSERGACRVNNYHEDPNAQYEQHFSYQEALKDAAKQND